MAREPSPYCACTHCGAQSPYPVHYINQYSGRIVRRRETCGQVFDIQIPLKNNASE